MTSDEKDWRILYLEGLLLELSTWMLTRNDLPEEFRKSVEHAQLHGMMPGTPEPPKGLYHRGWRFFPPYACGSCGKIISERQFAFSRCCGGCDVGDSKTRRFGIFDPRWFVAGKAILENPDDESVIKIEPVPFTDRENYPVLSRPRPVPPHRRPPRFGPPHRRLQQG